MPASKVASKNTANQHDDLADRNNVDVVVLATYVCGGQLRHIDTEDVAVKASEVAPKRFSWRKYPKQINIEQVRRRLSEGKAEGYLSGSQTEGWMMTAAGSKYVETDLIGLVKGNAGRTSIASADRHWMAAERKRLTMTAAFKKFKAANLDDIRSIDIGEFFRIDTYMTKEARRTKLDRFVSAFRNDQSLGAVVEYLVKRVNNEEEVTK